MRPWLLAGIVACSPGPVSVPIMDGAVEDAAIDGGLDAGADASNDGAMDASDDASSDGGDASDTGDPSDGGDASDDASSDAGDAGDASEADAGDAAIDGGQDAAPDAGMLGDFGAAGFVLGPLGGFAGGGDDQFFGIAVDGAQRVVAVGSSFDLNGARHALIVRYDAAGNLDPTFDGDGVVIGAALDDQYHHVAIDPQSRIVVAGERGDGQGRTWTLVARYLADGQLDATFGSAGFVVGRGAAQNDVPFSGFNSFPDERFNRVRIDSAGRIVAAGIASEIDQVWFYRTLVARFTAQGTLDPQFGGSGFAVGDGSNNNWYTGLQDFFFSLVLTPTDEVRAVGWCSDPTYVEERTLLVAFDSGGVFTDLDMGAVNAWAGGTKQVSSDVAIDGMGIAYTTGFSFDANNLLFVYLERHLPDGSLDATFGAGGHALARPPVTGSAAEYPFGIGIDSQGRIVISGFTDDAGNGGIDHAFIYRYTASGQLDVSFNTTGVPIAGAIDTWTNGISELAGGTDDSFNDLAITIGDRIYAAGTSNGRSVVARYRSDGCLDGPGCAN